ncbi:MAG: peptidylprolyl isomerase [Bacteroidales bacterium]|jgi:peptidyl-prolyl cis-trans isomerase SurA|nr:peptidylprolyl isomerase [Bacteroidales bacterium]MDX9798229.1 peptidylprolyl isomerase [Bacteroidales bacterium]
MKKIILISLICLVNLSGFAQTNVLDKVIAVVGKNMIKQSELETSYLQQKQRFGNVDDIFAEKCDLFEGLLINKLMLHQAQIDSIDITQEQVNRELDNRINYMIRQAGSRDILEKQMNKTVNEIKEYYQDLIKENILIGEVSRKLTSEVKVTPNEVTDFYNKIQSDSLPEIDEEYEFSQIVIHPKISDEEKQLIKERLNGYRERILKGDKFSTIATLYSEDPASAKKGGELGFFGRGYMVAEFESVAFSLREGEVSPVFETKKGFHIVQMIERRGDQVNCRHILLQPKVSNTELYRTKLVLDSVKNLISENKISFEEAIKQYSDDPSKLTGGTIINPYSASARFPKDNINEMMENLDKIDFTKHSQGDIVGPSLYKTELGSSYRLIKVTSKIPKHKINLKDDYDKIYNSALESAKTNAILDWANRRIPKTYIRIDNEYKDCTFRISWIKNK